MRRRNYLLFGLAVGAILGTAGSAAATLTDVVLQPGMTPYDGGPLEWAVRAVLGVYDRFFGSGTGGGSYAAILVPTTEAQ